MLNVNITVKAKFSSLPVEQNSSLQIVIFYNYIKEKTLFQLIIKNVELELWKNRLFEISWSINIVENRGNSLLCSTNYTVILIFHF